MTTPIPRMTHARSRCWPALGLVLLATVLFAGTAQATNTDTTPWEELPLWWGEASAVAISTTQPGWVATTVGHDHNEFGRAAVYMSGTYGAEWTWGGPFSDWRGAASPGSLLFLGSGRLHSGTMGGVSFTSNPAGTSWNMTGFDARYGNSFAHQLAASRASDLIVLVAVRGDDEWPGGILRTGLGIPGFLDITPPGLEGHHATAVAMHDVYTLRMAAATRSNSGQVSVIESMDAGDTWELLGDTLPAGDEVTALAYVGDTLLAAVSGRGLFARSGAGWTALGGRSPRLSRVSRLHVAYDDPMQVLAATATGLSISDDGGISWRHAVGGTSGYDVRDVATDPLGGDVVLLAVDGHGVMASVDGGNSFEISSQGIADAVVGTVAAHPDQPLQLAATVRERDRWQIAESYDGGQNWVLSWRAPTGARQLRYAPDGALWALAMGPGGTQAAYRRAASGQWRRTPIDAPALRLQSLAFATDAAGQAWVGGEAQVDGVLRAAAWHSDDDGFSWARAWTGPEGHAVASVSVVPGSAGAHVLVSTDRQQAGTPALLRLSLDGGLDWFEPDSAPQGDWTLVQLCTQDINDGSAVVFIRDPAHPFFGESTRVIALVDIASGGTWASDNPQAIGSLLLRSPECVSEGDVRRVYLVVESDEPLQAEGTVLRTFALGGFGSFGSWALDARQPTRANAMAFNAGGVYLASNRGLYRNPLSVMDAQPLISALEATSGRATRLVTVSWTGGGEWVDVYRDDEVVATIPNTGEYTERLLRRGDAAQYRVCNRFGIQCSQVETLSP